MATNEFTVKDSFDAVTHVNNIPRNLFNDGYRFVSFDVTSLFTNIPFKKTVNIILKRIYKNNLVSTTLKKRTLKKLILDSCTKTIFSSNGKLYKQIDGVSMGLPLGPSFANIIMTEFEDIIIKPLINPGTINSTPFTQVYNSQLTTSMTTTSIFSTSKFTPLVLLSTENLRILVNINTSLVFHLGLEKLLGHRRNLRH